MPIPAKNLLLLSDEALANLRNRLTTGSLIETSFRVGLFCFLLSAFLYLGGIPARVWTDIIPLSQHPFDFSALHEPILARRLTLPVLAHLLHLTSRGIIVIPIVCNFLTLLILYYELALHIGEQLAFLSVILLSLTTTTIIGNTWLGMPDPIANLMAAACLASTSPILVAVLSLIGLQSDERFAMMIPFIILWKIKYCINFKTSLKPLALYSLSIFAALLATGLIQLWVVGNAAPASIYRTTFIEVWRQHFSFPLHIPLAIFFGFRWAWWLPIYLVAVTPKSDSSGLSILTLGFIVLGATSAMMVGDMTRSMGQLFPGFVMVIFILARLRPNTLLRWLPITILAMVVTPMVDVWAINWFIRYPALIQIVRRLLSKHGVV